MDTVETIRDRVNKLRLKLSGFTCPICQSEFDFPIKRYRIENRRLLNDPDPASLHQDLYCTAAICKNCGFVSLHCYGKE